LLAQGDEARAHEVLVETRALISEAELAGIRRHPWLTLTSAALFQLSGETDLASRTFRRAATEGWRAWKVEQWGVAEPLQGERETVRGIEGDLARMLEVVRQDGLAISPALPDVQREARR
jgi:hypothetical protein